MDNLIFSLNATVPIFILMLLGMFLRRIGLMEGPFIDYINQFVFKAALPVLLFEDLSQSDIFHVWDTRFVLFCVGATLAGIFLAGGISLALKDKSLRGEFIQASYRSSAALLGIAFIRNIYGNAGMAWSALGLSQPGIMEKTVTSISAVATPLGLMAMGASFDWKKAEGAVKPALMASAMKLVILTAVFLPAAIWLGFRNQQLVAILVMLGSATTVSCFVMARNMGHEGVLTSSVVALTTCGSAFTLTCWLCCIRAMGLI